MCNIAYVKVTKSNNYLLKNNNYLLKNYILIENTQVSNQTYYFKLPSLLITCDTMK